MVPTRLDLNPEQKMAHYCHLPHETKHLSGARVSGNAIVQRLPRAVKPRIGLSGVRGHSARHATGHIPEAQCAFKILMIHEDLQFALRIAFRCVLHRDGSLDIRC